MSTNLIEKLTAEGNGENAVFLNDMVAQLWPNITAAVSEIVKTTVEPMFKTMLPGPLSSLHFTKIDLGTVPMKIDGVLATKSDTGSIKLDMNVHWDGECDIQLDGSMIPTLGVKGVKLYGRLSILLGPLTNVIPLIGAAQISFINPPVLKLDFTGAANIADFSAIDGAVRNAILAVINGMFTLPNRFLVKLDSNSDYFNIFLLPQGVIRITVERAYGFAEEAKGTAKKFFSKITRASPDCYAKVDVGAEPSFRTTTKNNTTSPAWNETHDFIVTDFDQSIKVDIEDHDMNGDDEVGIAVTTVKEVLLAGGKQDLRLVHKGEETEGKVSISCQYFKFETENSSFSASSHKGEGLISGLATILVAGAYGISGQRAELKPSVKVSWGAKNVFQTAIKADAPGTDINNPFFDQSFRVAVTSELASGGESFRIALFDGEKEVGGVDVPFADVAGAPNMILSNKWDVGGGATVRASIGLRGLGAADAHQATLPQR